MPHSGSAIVVSAYFLCRCLANLANECTAANDYGSCWRGDFKVDGVTKTFHACHDNIKEVKAKLQLMLLPKLAASLKWNAQSEMCGTPLCCSQDPEQAIVPDLPGFHIESAACWRI